MPRRLLRARTAKASLLDSLDFYGIGHTGGKLAGLATLLVAAGIFWVLARLVRNRVEREMSRRRIRPEVVVLVSRSAFVVVLVVALFVVVGFATRNGGVAVTGVLIATVLASLGIQDILRSYVSGVYLLTERRLTVGDEIEFGPLSGTIVEIKLRVTYVRGKEGALIIVPNSELFNNTVVVRSNQNAGAGDRPPVPASAAPAVAERLKAPRTSRKPRG